MAESGYYTKEYDPSTGTYKQVKKGEDTTKKGYVNPAEGGSGGLAEIARKAAEKRKKKKEMESLGGQKKY